MTSTTKKRLLDYIRACIKNLDKETWDTSEFSKGYDTAYREMLHVICNLPEDQPAIPTSTAQACSSGAPPWARYTWYDAEALYLEFPMANAVPYIMKFSFSNNGLQDALYTMRRLWQDCDVQAKEMYRKPLGGYTVKRSKKDIASPPTPATEAQTSAVREILRKGGYIK